MLSTVESRSSLLGLPLAAMPIVQARRASATALLTQDSKQSLCFPSCSTDSKATEPEKIKHSHLVSPFPEPAGTPDQALLSLLDTIKRDYGTGLLCILKDFSGGKPDSIGSCLCKLHRIFRSPYTTDYMWR